MTKQMTDATELTRLSKKIVEFYERLSSWEESVVRNSGLTTAQAHTIEMVGHSGAVKMKDLAEKIGITTGTLSVAVDRLEKKHLLKRTQHHTDRRAFLIELTPEGEACFREHHEFHLKMTRKIISEISASEQKTFADVIEKILKKI